MRPLPAALEEGKIFSIPDFDLAPGPAHDTWLHAGV